MTAVDTSLVAATTERILSELGDPRVVSASFDPAWKKSLWDALTESGLPLSWVSEASGGSGASLAEGFEIIQLAGRFALSVPLVETMLAGWLLDQAGLLCPSGPMAVLPARPADRIAIGLDGTWTGRASAVSFARDAEHFAVVADGPQGPLVGLVAASDCSISAGTGLSGDSLDVVTLDGVRPLRASAQGTADQPSILLVGCVARSLQMAGAMQSMLSLCLDYAGERIAFEKPIAKFQAIQHSLAKLASEAAVATAAATSAAEAFANPTTSGQNRFLEAVAAKIRCAEAASKSCAIAHQIHGAIGFTQEYVLHRYTLRALTWRDDFGNESHWAVELGKFIAAQGGHQLWPVLASR